jgi:hypothetical protein
MPPVCLLLCLHDLVFWIRDLDPQHCLHLYSISILTVMPLPAAMTSLPNSVHYDFVLGQPKYTCASLSSNRFLLGVTKRCRLSWLTKSALVYEPQGADPPPPSSTRGKAGRNNLNEEITPLHPHWKGERFSQTISNLGHAALLRRRELPL